MVIPADNILTNCLQNTLKSLANVLSLFREDFSAYSAATRANLEDIVWHAVHLFD